MNEEQLKEMVTEIDDFIATMMTKYHTSILSCTSIILARLVLTNDLIGSGNDYRTIMSEVIKKELGNSEKVVH